MYENLKAICSEEYMNLIDRCLEECDNSEDVEDWTWYMTFEDCECDKNLSIISQNGGENDKQCVMNFVNDIISVM